MAHLRERTLSPVVMPLWGLEFEDLDRRMYRSTFGRRFLDLNLSILLLGVAMIEAA